MCRDTPPQPRHFGCGNPSIEKYPDHCQARTTWGKTLYHNLMGYGFDTCRESLTPLQLMRMKCWYDHSHKRSHPEQKLIPQKSKEGGAFSFFLPHF